jgi:hypothetical protein
VDILALYSEVAQAIAREIKVAVTPEEQTLLASTRPVNPEAHRPISRRGTFDTRSRRKAGERVSSIAGRPST